MSLMPDCSVVIASHRPECIGGCVSALRGGDSPAVEIIVVCDYDPALVMRGEDSVRWVHEPVLSISFKRNRGIALARAAIVAFVDDDCIVEKGWAAAGCAALRDHPDWAGAEGRTVIGDVGCGGPHLREFMRLEQRGMRTNNIFYAAEVLRAVQGFDERFSVQREDIDLAFRILDTGAQIGYCADAVVSHLFRPHEPWDLLKNCINRRFDPLLYKKHPRRYRGHIRSPWPPSLAGLLAAHALAVVALTVVPQHAVVIILTDAAIVAAVTLRRTYPHRLGAGAWLRELFACAVAPGVLLAALLWGSVRFRRLFVL